MGTVSCHLTNVGQLNWNKPPYWILGQINIIFTYHLNVLNRLQFPTASLPDYNRPTHYCFNDTIFPAFLGNDHNNKTDYVIMMSLLSINWQEEVIMSNYAAVLRWGRCTLVRPGRLVGDLPWLHQLREGKTEVIQFILLINDWWITAEWEMLLKVRSLSGGPSPICNLRL